MSETSSNVMVTDPAAENPQTSLSIIIPAYNEENSIHAVLDELNAVLSGTDYVYEIIVIDDGSTDNTAAVAEAHGSARVLRHIGNRGYGAALKTGIRHSRHGLICITDADSTYPNERIPDLITRMHTGGYDMVVGARTGQNVRIPLVRRPAKWAIRQLANLVVGTHIPDLNSGLRLFTREGALRFFSLLPDGFSFTTTITLGMLTNGYLVDYVSIDYHARVGQSKIKPIRDTLNFIQLILRIALYFAPLKIFLPVSLALLGLGIVWGLFSFFILQQLADVSTLMFFMSAVQIAAIGLLAELINRRLPNDYREE